MSVRFELLAEMVMVVDFAVEDNPTRVVFVAEWLAASRDVNDRKSPMPQCGLPISKDTAAVWTPMTQLVRHRPNRRAHLIAQRT
jgi:hypothetical protein